MNPLNKFELSNRLFVLLIVFMITLVGFWSFRAYEIWKSDPNNYPREIYVEGIGTAYASPDIAKVTLGVATEGKTSDATVSENTKKINAVMTVLKESGIEEKDIKTMGYYLNPIEEYVQKTGNYVKNGYKLDQSLEVTIRDFDKVGELITKTTKAGVNNIGGVNFQIENRDAVKNEARQKAIVKAKEKAEQIAKETGLKLGRVISFSEYETTPDFYGKGGYAAMDASVAQPVPPVLPGEQEISLSVSLSYGVY